MAIPFGECLSHFNGIVRMLWHTPLWFYTFPPVGFSMQLLDWVHHPYISTGFGLNIFTPLVSVLFMECQLHIMEVKSLILGTHEPHA